MRKLKSTLLALMTAVVLCVSSCVCYAQSMEPEDCSPVILECEILLDEMAATRDRAIQNTDAVETERDVEAGKRLTFEKLYYDERANAAKPRVPDWVWVALGATAVVVVEAIVVALVVVL
jgi:hypothetical protein